MKETRAMEMVDELVNILLSIVDDVQFVEQRLETAGFSQDEIRSIGFEVEEVV